MVIFDSESNMHTVFKSLLTFMVKDIQDIRPVLDNF